MNESLFLKNCTEKEVLNEIAYLTKLYNDVYDNYFDLCENAESMYKKAHKYEIEFTSDKQLVDKLLLLLKTQIEYVENEFLLDDNKSYVPKHISEKLQKGCS